MAVSVDTVYQKVLAISNKEQRGYITPQEFNLLADRAQYEIYQNYFNEIRNAEKKLKNKELYSDIVEENEHKLKDFLSSFSTGFVNSTGLIQIANNTYKLISVSRGSVVQNVTTFFPVEIINTRQRNLNNSHPFTRPNIKRSVFTPRADLLDRYELFPHPVTNNDTTLVIDYYRNPHPPNWTYVVVNEQALYNESAPDHRDFELHYSERENLVNKILQLAGVIIKQPDIQQAAINSYQMYNQEKNN